MFDSAWHHDEFAFFQPDVMVFFWCALAELHAEAPFYHQKHFVFVLVMVEDELTFQLVQLHVLAVEFGGDVKCLTEMTVYITIYTMSRTAKVFRNGRSQAVRLPAEYRFDGPEVYIRRDPNTGDVILSRRPESWAEFFELADRIGVPEDFMSDRGDVPPQKRKLF